MEEYMATQLRLVKPRLDTYLVVRITSKHKAQIRAEARAAGYRSDGAYVREQRLAPPADERRAV